MSKREVKASHGQASGTEAQSRGESQSDLCGFEGAKPKLRSESESGNESGSGSEALRGSRGDESRSDREERRQQEALGPAHFPVTIA